MTRVWLERWEWACCGDPFAVGDEVDFGIRSRTPHPAMADMLAPELISTVDAIESHHESEFTDRVRGRVVAVHAITHEITERRTLRRPGHGAPSDAVMPADGEEWPMNRLELGNGAFAGSQPSRYVTESVPVPHSAALESVGGVGVAPEPLPALQPGHALAGWFVDVDES
ncbi:DUF6578 domain-containing protein [Microbacterium sp. A196]|uniref:DUF6578 domain-containing protein n=1 Tax=unclassified Microbacterium TaxID=2609290 RepID=UPI003FD4C7DB